MGGLRFFPAFLVAGLLACESGALTDPTANRVERPSFSATTSTTSSFVPLNLDLFVPCANGGAGELVTLSGSLHVLIHTTISESGVATFYVHFQPQGVSGVGSVTGDKYQGTGVTMETLVVGPSLTDTFVNNFNFFGQGSGNSFKTHQTIHVTINANGDVTATVSNVSVSCS